MSLAKPDEEPPIHRVGTAVRLLEVRAVTQAMVGAGAGGSGLSAAAVYVIVVQGVERLTFEPAGATAQEKPHLRLTARRFEPGPELDHESATIYGLALQSLAQEVPNWVEGEGAADAQLGASSLLAHHGAASLLAAVRRSGGRMDASTLALLVSAA